MARGCHGPQPCSIDLPHAHDWLYRRMIVHTVYRRMIVLTVYRRLIVHIVYRYNAREEGRALDTHLSHQQLFISIRVAFY